MIEFVEAQETSTLATPRIKVIGIGGAGGNTIKSMVNAGLNSIEFIAANTDAQALEQCNATITIQLGTKLTKGLGSGANPEVGKKATEEDIEALSAHLKDADIVFLTAGLGGGTGSGGIPIVARLLKEKNILTIAVVTKPFVFEGKRRARIAEETLEQLKGLVDTLIVIPNQKLTDVAEKNVSLLDAFNIINSFVGQFVKSISHIITKPGHINVDFADVQAIMRNMGSAIMGTGSASGSDRAEKATLQAISSPLLEGRGIKGAKGVLLNITGNTSLGLHEVSTAATLVYDEADENANIVLGSVIDESMGDEIAVTIIATGFERTQNEARTHEEKTVATPKKSSEKTVIGEAPTTHIKPAEVEFSDELEIPAILRNQKKSLDLPQNQ